MSSFGYPGMNPGGSRPWHGRHEGPRYPENPWDESRGQQGREQGHYQGSGGRQAPNWFGGGDYPRDWDAAYGRYHHSSGRPQYRTSWDEESYRQQGSTGREWYQQSQYPGIEIEPGAGRYQGGYPVEHGGYRRDEYGPSSQRSYGEHLWQEGRYPTRSDQRNRSSYMDGDTVPPDYRSQVSTWGLGRPVHADQTPGLRDKGHWGRGLFSSRSRAPKGYKRADERIQDDVCQRLMYDQALDTSDIEISVKQGEVVLEGTVPSRHDKFRAEQLAESVLGVDDVTNKLRVRRHGSSGSQSHAEPATGISRAVIEGADDRHSAQSGPGRTASTGDQKSASENASQWTSSSSNSPGASTRR